jgi:hypothetical protein
MGPASDGERLMAGVWTPARTLQAGVDKRVVWAAFDCPISDDDRKHTGGGAIHDPDGRLCAYSAGLWIELRDPATMGAKMAETRRSISPLAQVARVADR